MSYEADKDMTDLLTGEKYSGIVNSKGAVVLCSALEETL